MKVIRFVIKKDGSVEIDYQGFVGNQCHIEHEKIVELLKSLGVKFETVVEKEKPEAKIRSEEALYITA